MTDAGPLRSARRGWPRGTEGPAWRERARSWARRGLSLRRGRGGGAAELSPPPAPARRSLPLDVARTLPSAMLTASAAPGRLRAGGGRAREAAAAAGTRGERGRAGAERAAEGAGSRSRPAARAGACYGEESPLWAPWRQPRSLRCVGMGGTLALGPWGPRPADGPGGSLVGSSPPSLARLRALTLPSVAVGGFPGRPEAALRAPGRP